MVRYLEFLRRVRVKIKFHTSSFTMRACRYHNKNISIGCCSYKKSYHILNIVLNTDNFFFCFCVINQSHDIHKRSENISNIPLNYTFFRTKHCFNYWSQKNVSWRCLYKSSSWKVTFNCFLHIKIFTLKLDI